MGVRQRVKNLIMPVVEVARVYKLTVSPRTAVLSACARQTLIDILV